MIHVPQSPLPIRAINVIGNATRGVGLVKMHLNADELIETAQKKTGLLDFGEGPHYEALHHLTDSLERDAYLTPVGCFLARSQLLDGLANQLKLQDWFNRHPEIAEQKVDSPVIIIGMPRTGTTIMHELMALDPSNRIPQSWEVAQPFPSPETATYTTDPRIAQETKKLAFSHYLMPGVENMHRMGAQLPQECVAITAHVFASMLYNTIYRIPDYAHWLLTQADMAPYYRYHRRMHQFLQWRCPNTRWVIKSPGHLWALAALLNEYPNALLVQTHRDPLKIVSSLASMVPTMRSCSSYLIDPAEVAREWSDCCALALNASLRTRQSGIIKPAQIIDIQFDEFMSSQSGAVEKIYRQFGIEFTPALQQSIQDYIAANPADKHGGHTHHFMDTGLDYEQEREKVRAYQEYFQVPSEF